MGGIVVGCFCVGLIAWAMNSPAFEWLRNLFWRGEPQDVAAEHFVVSEYLARIEKASLKILESREPVEQIVVLWWGLDGIRLNEDGSIEWISRKSKPPASQGFFNQLCQTAGLIVRDDIFQSTQAQIDALMAQNTQLQAQAWHAEQNRQMINALQSYVVRWPGYYARLTDCCCNQIRDRF